MPLALDKAQFTNFASKTIDFVKNTGGAANKVNKHYFIIGDYLASPGKFAYCDPNPQGSEAGASWLITEWLNKLPDDVEAGLEIWMDPGDALTLDNPSKQPADKSKYNYKGNVIITQGTLEVTANEVEIFTADGEVIQIIAKTEEDSELLAHYQQQVNETMDMVVADARKITYLVQEERLHLSGDARLQQVQDVFTGQLLYYDLGRGIVNLNSSGGSDRVNMTITPKKSSR